jgi:hypothetical protein
LKAFSALLLFVSAVLVVPVRAAQSDNQQSEILNRYFAAVQDQQNNLRGVSMQVDIDAEVPKLKRYGKLRALRNISKLGKITYRMLGFNGDNSVKKDVIGRYLSAEVEAQNGPNISITPVNYKFKYKGLEQRDGQDVHIFELSPRKKQFGLFKGELWLDARTCLPVRESGRFVKNPSVFLKRMEFVRIYEVQNGMSVPQRLESLVATRLFGPVQMSINFSKFTREPEEDAVLAGATDLQ